MQEEFAAQNQVFLATGVVLDTASIILIVVPLFLPITQPMGLPLVWFGIITVVGAEIGLLTPPLGISCIVIKATLNDDRTTLKDRFLGALGLGEASDDELAEISGQVKQAGIAKRGVLSDDELRGIVEGVRAMG